MGSSLFGVLSVVLYLPITIDRSAHVIPSDHQPVFVQAGTRLLEYYSMNDKVVSALSRAFFDTKMVTARMILALSEFLWGVLLLWPGETFGRPTYHLMADVMSEIHWGVLFLATAALQMSIVIGEDYYRPMARYFAGYNAILWCFVVGSMLLSVYPPPAAISAEIVMAGTATWIWFRPILLCKWIIHVRRTKQV